MNVNQCMFSDEPIDFTVELLEVVRESLGKVYTPAQLLCNKAEVSWRVDDPEIELYTEGYNAHAVAVNMSLTMLMRMLSEPGVTPEQFKQALYEATEALKLDNTQSS